MANGSVFLTGRAWRRFGAVRTQRWAAWRTISTGADPASGLRPGLGAHAATFRGEHAVHRLRVSAKRKTVQLDDGPVIGFEGPETNLEVPATDGAVLYLDVSGLVAGFEGELAIGAMGRVRRILWNEVLVQ